MRRHHPGATHETPVARGELLVGRLVDHGPAPYQHKPNQSMPYYVRIETEHGDRELWGVDLERAFRQSLSTPGIGDEVGVRSIGRDPVTVIAPKHDSADARSVARSIAISGASSERSSSTGASRWRTSFATRR